MPLGWALSEESIVEMQRQMWCEPKGCEYSNARRVLDMVEQLGVERVGAEQRLLGLCSGVQGRR